LGESQDEKKPVTILDERGGEKVQKIRGAYRPSGGQHGLSSNLKDKGLSRVWGRGNSKKNQGEYR